jgi:hypothetical protein
VSTAMFHTGFNRRHSTQVLGCLWCSVDCPGLSGGLRAEELLQPGARALRARALPLRDSPHARPPGTGAARADDIMIIMSGAPRVKKPAAQVQTLGKPRTCHCESKPRPGTPGCGVWNGVTAPRPRQQSIRCARHSPHSPGATGYQLPSRRAGQRGSVFGLPHLMLSSSRGTKRYIWMQAAR